MGTHERLGASSAVRLLDKIKTLQATVTKLGERKKANQRKVCEANLDRRRAEQAGEKAPPEAPAGGGRRRRRGRWG